MTPRTPPLSIGDRVRNLYASHPETVELGEVADATSAFLTVDYYDSPRSSVEHDPDVIAAIAEILEAVFDTSPNFKTAELKVVTDDQSDTYVVTVQHAAGAVEPVSIDEIRKGQKPPKRRS